MAWQPGALGIYCRDGADNIGNIGIISFMIVNDLARVYVCLLQGVILLIVRISTYQPGL